MAKLEIITLVCDVCQAEGDKAKIKTHRLTVDTKAPRELEACAGCWDTASLPVLLKAARVVSEEAA